MYLYVSYMNRFHELPHEINIIVKCCEGFLQNGMNTNIINQKLYSDVSRT